MVSRELDRFRDLGKVWGGALVSAKVQPMVSTFPKIPKVS